MAYDNSRFKPASSRGKASMGNATPATGGASSADLERGYTNELEPDPNPFDVLEGYSDPLGDDMPGFIKRKNRHERL